MALYNRDKETFNFLAIGTTMPYKMTLPHIPFLFARKVNHPFTSFFSKSNHYIIFKETLQASQEMFSAQNVELQLM